MTLGARRLPRVDRRRHPRVVDRAGAVVAKPAEVVRHHLRTDDDEEQPGDQEDRRETNQVLCIFERERHPSDLVVAVRSASRRPRIHSIANCLI
jgi:hypothetical protein